MRRFSEVDFWHYKARRDRRLAQQKLVAVLRAVVAEFKRVEPSRQVFAAGLSGCVLWTLVFGLAHAHTLPPSEDEVLALTVGRHSLIGAMESVLDDRGGAPLHFLLAWVVVHLGGHLYWLRVASTIFAAAAVGTIGCFAAKLTDRLIGLVTAILTSSTWLLLFNDVFGRMYSLFLFTSAASSLAVIYAVERNTKSSRALWGAAAYLTVASHPYGILVLAAQAIFAVIRSRRKAPVVIVLGLIALLGIPLWRSDLILRSRYTVGVGSGGQLDSVGALWSYLQLTLRDLTTGTTNVFWLVLALSALGAALIVARNSVAGTLIAVIAVVPFVFLVALDAGHTASPQSRHLIFWLPFISLCVASGLVFLASCGRRLPYLTAVTAAALLSTSYIGWAHHRTPSLFRHEATSRTTARASAARWLASSSRPSDVLMGYEPTYELAWAMNSSFSSLVVPRADPTLAAKALTSFPSPLGRAVWVFDAANVNLGTRQRYMALPIPALPSSYVVKEFGPYLVVKTRNPVRTVARYISAAEAVMAVVKQFGVVNADLELHTLQGAAQRVTGAAAEQLVKSIPGRKPKLQPRQETAPAGMR